MSNSKGTGIWQIDPLFTDRPQIYRSIIINGLNKLVYRINDNTIHIVVGHAHATRRAGFMREIAYST